MYNTKGIRSRIVRTKAATISTWSEMETGGGTWAMDAGGASATAGTSNILQHLVGGFADMKVTAVLKTSTTVATQQLGVMVRFMTNKTGEATYYYLRQQTGTARITKVVNGTFTNLASGTFGLLADTEYTFTLSVVGSSLVGRIDDGAGNFIDLSASDSAIAGPGISGARAGPTNSTQISVKSIQTEEITS